jgi:hypothetical protein
LATDDLTFSTPCSGLCDPVRSSYLFFVMCYLF